MELDKKIIEVAELLHKALCTWNHTDGCSWFYEEWENINFKDKYRTKVKYYVKACDIVKIIGYDNAKAIIKIL